MNLVEPPGERYSFTIRAVIAPLGLLGVGQGESDTLLQRLRRVLHEHADPVLAKAHRLAPVHRGARSIVVDSIVVDSVHRHGPAHAQGFFFGIFTLMLLLLVLWLIVVMVRGDTVFGLHGRVAMQRRCTGGRSGAWLRYHGLLLLCGRVEGRHLGGGRILEAPVVEAVVGANEAGGAGQGAAPRVGGELEVGRLLRGGLLQGEVRGLAPPLVPKPVSHPLHQHIILFFDFIMVSILNG